jgi:hypothetical protein
LVSRMENGAACTGGGKWATKALAQPALTYRVHIAQPKVGPCPKIMGASH